MKDNSTSFSVLCFKMPPKKTLTATKAKKATKKASSTGRVGRISTRASNSQRALMGESFLLPQDYSAQSAVATANSPTSPVHPRRDNRPPSESHDSVMALLADISDNQRALASRVSNIEAATQQRIASQTSPPMPVLSLPPNDHLSQGELPRDRTTGATVPALDSLRSQQDLARAPDEQLDTLEGAVRAQHLGKQAKKSGRFNTSDLPSADPTVRWPNEGTKLVAGRRKLPYDELSIPQWVYGQLTNIMQVDSYVTQRYMILQIISAMKDAAHLPWHAGGAAYANSMQDIEEGTLRWCDTMTWAVNRLSASQIAFAGNVQVVQPRPHTPSESRPLRICRFFTEGTCTRQGNHGSYCHPCMICFRARRPDDHAEESCPTKFVSRAHEPPRSYGR